MCWRSPFLLLASLAILCPLSAQEEPASRGSSDAAVSSQPAETVTLQDGSPVFLRFAQPVYGLLAAPKRVAIQKGARIRLVAGADVRVNGQVVIAKGAIGQATVTNVLPHGATISNNGLSLRLDWVETITGARAFLRPGQAGKSVPFDLKIYSTKGGIEVVPHVRTPGHMLADTGKFISGWDVFRPKAFHERTWIPAGSRLHVFLDGDLTLPAEEVSDAQADLPVPNLTATLYIFRTKDHKGPSPAVSCDQGAARSLGPRQSAVFELQPGSHSCKAANLPGIEFTMEAGNDYFVRLQPSGGKWKLQRVTEEEGEDRVATCELLSPETSESNPQ